MMASCALLVLLFSGSFSDAISGYIGDGNLSENLIRSGMGITTDHLPEPCYINYSCVNNCTAVRVCAPTADRRGLREIGRYSCPSTAAWCDTLSGTCVAEQPQHCLVPAQFPCPRDGNFPNLNDCSSYFQCVSGISYIFKCVTPKRYYNVNTESCATSTTCPTNRLCEGKNNVKVKVTDSKQLFVYCANSSIAMVDKCVGAYQFNVNTQMCDRFCPHAGLFPSADNCTNYYKCEPQFKTATTFNITEKTCPPGEGFLESAYECVNRTLVPNCQVALPAMYSKK